MSIDLERALARKTEQVRALQELALELSRIADLHRRLATILEALVLLVRARAMVLLLDDHTSVLRVAASVGCDPVGTEMRAGEDLLADFGAEKLAIELGTDRPIGVLVVEHDDALDEEHLDWIDALAEQAVATIHLEDTILARSIELKKAQARMLESKKMAALVHLVAGITHEMNSPLGTLVSGSDTIERAVAKLRRAEGPPASGVLVALSDSNRAVADAAKRIDTIVRRLKSFVRLDEAVQQEIGVETCLEDALALLSHRLEKISLVRDYTETAVIVCYPARLNEVFSTILRNACDAVEGKPGATIVVRTRAYRASVCVEIDDNGVGMSEEEIQRVFDPGFNARDTRVRMGLGLAIAHQVVGDHSGEIAFESQIGLGTKVSIELPITPSAARAPV